MCASIYCQSTYPPTASEIITSTNFAIKTGRVAAGGSLLVGGIAGALALAPQAGAATTYTVTNTADSGAGSLRQAVDDANNNSGFDIIVFDASAAGTITLTTGEIAIDDDVSITGLGSADSIISGNNNSRIFYMYDFALTVSISGLAMTDGNTLYNGGAILSNGNDLTLSKVVVTGNVSVGGGGGIVTGAGNGTSGSLMVIDSEISNNTSGADGGGIVHGSGDLTIRNSTFRGNIADMAGGGVFTRNAGDITIDSSMFDENISGNDPVDNSGSGGGGLYATRSSSFTMLNSTISGNEARDAGGLELGENGNVLIVNSTIADNVTDLNTGVGSALWSWGSTGNIRVMFSTISGNVAKNYTVKLADLNGYGFEVTGTILSDNTTGQGGGAQAVDVYAYGASSLSVSSSLIMGSVYGNNLDDRGGNVRGVSAQLGVLADNGGATFTMEPAVGSPVIDAGPLSWAPFAGDGFDQRGGLFLRVYNGRSDMGAFEVQPDPTATTTTTTTTTTAPSSTTTTTTTAPTSSSTTLLGSIDTTTTVATDPVVPAFTG